jgi:hypothetical protein
VPLEALAYQLITAPLDDALMVSVPAPQRALFTPVGRAGRRFIVAGTGVRDADTSPVDVFRASA